MANPLIPSRTKWRMVFLLRLVGVFYASLLSRDVEAAGLVEQMTIRHWHVQDGLPENNVQAFAQTADGFLWIGTTGGLVRFDGKSLEIFDHSNCPAFVEGSVTTLLGDGDGLWIGTDGGGLIHWDGGRFVRYAVPGATQGKVVRTLSRDHQGRLLMTNDEGVVAWKDRAGTASDVAWISKATDVRAPDAPAGESIALGVQNAEFLRGFMGRTHTQIRGSIRAVLETRDGARWIGTEDGLLRRTKDSERFVLVPNLHMPISQLLESSDGSIWVGTLHDGLFLLKGSSRVPIVRLREYHANSIHALFEDSDHSIWVGTQSGMFQLIASSVHLLTLPDRFNSEFSTVYIDSEGALYVAARKLLRIHDGAASVVILPQLGNAEVRNVVQSRDGALWLGTTRSGVFRVTPKETQHYAVQEGLAHNSVRVMSPAPDGSMWIGTDAGVSAIRDGHVTSYRVADGLSDPMVHALVADRLGQVWVGTARGLNRIVHGKFVNDELTERLKNDMVWTIFITQQREPWIGTRNDGLYSLHQNQILHFTTAQGLNSNSIYKILGSSRDRLWLSGPGGVAAVSMSTLISQHGIGKEIVPRLFFIADDKDTPNFYSGLQATGVMAADGDVWFPTDHGLVHILAADETPSLTRLRIKSAMVNGKSIPDLNNIVLSPDDSNVQITYGALSLLPQVGLRYRYRLENLDQQWTYVQNHSTAYFTNLPPGKFRFHVQAYQAGDPDEGPEAVLTIIKHNHFYRTWWFGGILLFAVLALLWTGYRLRVRSAHARLTAVYDERLRLSREMHDTVLQGCAGVSSLLEAHGSAFAEGEASRALLQCAREQIGTTMDSTRRAIQSLRDSGAPMLSTDERLKELTARLSLEFPHAFVYTYRGSKTMLAATAMHDVEMVTKEAMYNALVHSSGTRFTVQARGERRRLTVEVRDDGVGMQTGDELKQGHYGLMGMKERIWLLGGELSLSDGDPRGTVVTFHIPVP